MINPENTPEHGSDRGDRPRGRWLFPTVLTVAVVVAVGALAWTAYPGAADRDLAAAAATTDPGITSTAAPTTSPVKNAATAKPAPAKPAPGIPGVPLDNTHAKASLHSFLGAVATVDSAPHVKDQLSQVATGAILEELGNQQLELDSNGWTQRGQSTVGAVKVLRTTEREATVQACIDSSAVEILDTEGNPIGTPSTHRRALNIYTLTHKADGSWQVTDRTFPDNPAC